MPLPRSMGLLFCVWFKYNKYASPTDEIPHNRKKSIPTYGGIRFQIPQDDIINVLFPQPVNTCVSGSFV